VLCEFKRISAQLRRHLVAATSTSCLVLAAPRVAHTRGRRRAVVATQLKWPMLEVVAVAIAPRPRLVEATKKMKAGQVDARNLRVLPALVMDLVHVAVAFVVRILGLDIEYLGLVEELEVETEHFLILRVLGIVSLGWSHGREICRVILVLWNPVFYMFQPEVEVVVVVVCCNERGTGVHGNLGNAFWHTTSVLGLGPPRFGILLDGMTSGR
jgi:hypothetical protein